MVLQLLLPLCYLSMTSGLPPGNLPGGGGGPHAVTQSNDALVNETSSVVVLVVNFSNGSVTRQSTMSPEDREANAPKSASLLNLTNIQAGGTPSAKSISRSSSSSSTSSSSIGVEEGGIFSSSAGGKEDADLPPLSPKFHAPSALTALSNTSKVRLRGECNSSSQCIGDFTVCRQHVCNCMPGYLPRQDNGELCGHSSLYQVPLPSTDPTMIGVVIGLCFMSVTLCVVLRLFAKARFRENRTIFNTPNPRLMNASLLGKGSKQLFRGNSAPRSRRGSTASARSGFDPISPTSPLAEHPINGHHDNGSALQMAGSSGRSVRPHRQHSTDTGGEGTPSSTRHAAAMNKQREKFRHQDSIASNV